MTAYLLARGPLDLALYEARTTTFIAITTAQLLAVFNARTDRGSGIRGATANPYLWGALALTVTLEALALSVGPLRDLLGLTVLPSTAWLTAHGLATVPTYRSTRCHGPDPVEICRGSEALVIGEHALEIITEFESRGQMHRVKRTQVHRVHPARNLEH